MAFRPWPLDGMAAVLSATDVRPLCREGREGDVFECHSIMTNDESSSAFQLKTRSGHDRNSDFGLMGHWARVSTS